MRAVKRLEQFKSGTGIYTPKPPKPRPLPPVRPARPPKAVDPTPAIDRIVERADWLLVLPAGALRAWVEANPSLCEHALARLDEATGALVQVHQALERARRRAKQ